MLRKFFLFFLGLFLLFTVNCSLFVCETLAEGEFSTNLDVTYLVNPNGITTVSNRVTLTNNFSNLYATSYSLILENMNPINIKAFDEQISYDLNTESNGSTTTINVNFPNEIVGKNQSRVFWITYEESSYAVKTGEVWEISIPKISNKESFSSYFLTLSVPESFGQLAYMSPSFKQSYNSNGMINFKFNIDDVSRSGVVAGFGNFQVFSFDINYHLENPLNKSANTQIAIPPDSAFQKMYYTDISPRPKKFFVDMDGNWIAEYSLSPRQRVDIKASGSVQIFSSQRSFPEPSKETLEKSLIATNYWQSNDTTIKELAQIYNTPEKIYNFVVSKLNYDYSRVKPNVERLGAIKALQMPDSAICMEFTDLFIAVARSAGIPAREVNGYAYTENTKIQPLSLVNDVLHSWPEYYDYQKKSWIPVDPTWGSTTEGVDFFNKLDLRHFSFVFHGSDDTKPYPPGSYKLGTNPQKDVFVSFGSLPEDIVSSPKIKAQIGGWIPFLPNRIEITLENHGPSALYSLSPQLFFDEKLSKEEIFIEAILPFSDHQFFVEVPFSFLGTNTPKNVKVGLDNNYVEIKTNKNQVLVYNLILVFAAAIVILVTVMFRLKKWKIKLPVLRGSR